jgi:hypothetical protein
MATVIYSPEKEKPQPRKASLTLNGVLIEPGFNTLDEKNLVAIKSHPDFHLYESWGAIQIIQDGSHSLTALTPDGLFEESSDELIEELAKPRRKRTSTPKTDIEDDSK